MSNRVISQRQLYEPAEPFSPHTLVSHPRLQTVLANIRPSRTRWIEARERMIVLDAGEDVTGFDRSGTHARLHGYYTPAILDARRDELEFARPGEGRGFVLALHGWEGSSHSNYNVVITDVLARAGYEVFRLNLRDHGPGIHLNPYALNRGLFLGTLLDEAIAAVKYVAPLAGSQPFYMMGPSMGGNFALRMALDPEINSLPNLRRIVVVSPALSPGNSIDAIDSHLVYRLYFRHHWLSSLLAKQELYPDTYDFDEIRSIPSLRDMTEWLMQHYGPYANAEEYFADYAVPVERLSQLKVPASIIVAEDDEVIPVDDVYRLPEAEDLGIQVHATGGHVGFVDIQPFHHCLPDLVLAQLST